MPSLGRALLLATAALALLQVSHALSNQCACAQGQPGGQASAADVMQQWDDCSGAVLYYAAHVHHVPGVDIFGLHGLDLGG
jgi:hypothetical protein